MAASRVPVDLERRAPSRRRRRRTEGEQRVLDRLDEVVPRRFAAARGGADDARLVERGPDLLEQIAGLAGAEVVREGFQVGTIEPAKNSA
jgi:hypothetical protein